MTRVALIAAVARNGVIGRNNGLPWRLPSDLKRFKALTMGKAVVMGRRTYESLPGPLPGRRIIVVTRDRAFYVAGVEVGYTVDEGLKLAKAWARANAQDEVFVAGGGELYRQTIEVADRLYLTELDIAPDGDARFPAIDPFVWREVVRQPGQRGDRDEANFAFVTYERVAVPSG